MEYKSFDVEFKADEQETGIVTAYASTFGNTDRVNDVVIKGAFIKSIESGLIPKFLWNHNMNLPPIGVVQEVYEDEKGLYAKLKLANTNLGNEMKELCSIGAVTHLSIGYTTDDYDFTPTGERILKAVTLWEISLVNVPANELATITSVKSTEEKAADEQKERFRSRLHTIIAAF